MHDGHTHHTQVINYTHVKLADELKRMFEVKGGPDVCIEAVGESQRTWR